MNTRVGMVSGAVAWRHLHNFRTNPALLLRPLMLPLFLFAAFAGSLSALSHTPGFAYPDYGSFQFIFGDEWNFFFIAGARTGASPVNTHAAKIA